MPPNLNMTRTGIVTAARDQPWWTKRLAQCMFADDVVLLNGDVAGMQTILQACNKFSKRWRLWFNVKKNKSEACIFTTERAEPSRPPTPLKLGTRTLGFTTDYKYLGLLTNANGLLASHIAKRAEQYQNTVNFRVRARGHVHHTCLPVGIRSMIARVFGATGVDYGLGVWGPMMTHTQLATLEKTHIEAARHVLHAGPLPVGGAVRSELGWTSVHRRVQDLQLRFYARIQRMDETRMPRLIYEARRFGMALATGPVRQANAWFTNLQLAAQEMEMDLNSTTAHRKPRPLAADDWALELKGARCIAGDRDLQQLMQDHSSMTPFLPYDRACEPQHYLTGGARPDSIATRTQLRLRMGTMRLRAASNRGARPKPLTPIAPERFSECCSGCLRRLGLVNKQTEIHVVMTCQVHKHARKEVAKVARKLGIPWSEDVLGQLVFGSLSPIAVRRKYDIGPEKPYKEIQQLFIAVNRMMASIGRTHEVNEKWRINVFKQF